MSKYNNTIRHFKGKRLLVIGDVVLDQYIKGSVSRISPEAPVPIVLQEESFYTPGGAANVANNLASLGADVTLVSKIGDDIRFDQCANAVADKQHPPWAMMWQICFHFNFCLTGQWR